MDTKNKLVEIFVDAQQATNRHSYLTGIAIQNDPRWITLMEEVGWEEIMKNLPTFQDMRAYAQRVIKEAQAAQKQ